MSSPPDRLGASWPRHEPSPGLVRDGSSPVTASDDPPPGTPHDDSPRAPDRDNDNTSPNSDHDITAPESPGETRPPSRPLEMSPGPGNVTTDDPATGATPPQTADAPAGGVTPRHRPSEPEQRDEPEPDTDDDADHTSLTGDAAGGAPAGGGANWLPWTLVVVLAGLLAWVWFGALAPLQQEQDQRDTVRVAASNFLTTLTNWDAADGFADTQDELLGMATEGFATEVGNVFSAVDDLIALEAVSSGRIEDLFVQDIEDDTAVLFGVVEQTIATNQPGEPSVILRSFRTTFVRQDGDWLVQRMELVAEQQLEGGTPGVPNIGSDAPSEPNVTGSDASSPSIDNTVAPTDGETP